MSGRRRRFGYVRRLPSGRWQASAVAPDGSRRPAPTTFGTKTEASQWLAARETDQLRGTWVDDRLAEVRFGDYAQRWLRDHPRLGPRWRETCERNLRLHLHPLADLPLRQLTPVVVRVARGGATRHRWANVDRAVVPVPAGGAEHSRRRRRPGTKPMPDPRRRQ